MVELNEYISDDKVTIMNVTITQSNGADRGKMTRKMVNTDTSYLL